MKFAEVLTYFKSKENPDVLLTLDDSIFRNAFVAWRAMKIQYVDIEIAEIFETESDINKWEWLWKRVRYDTAYFAKIAGIKEHDSNTMITRLQGLKLIYPDGTINEKGSAYLQGVIMSRLPKRAKKT